MQRPLLTIAIPTYNRADYLARTLRQLTRELADIPVGQVELIVSDNASEDGTAAVTAGARVDGLDFRLMRNPVNVGSDANIAQAFNLASGHYVLILGDDDLLCDGAIKALLPRLAGREFGVVCLRPYGYVRDFRAEYPGGNRKARRLTDPGAFLAAIGPLMTLISALVINKDFLEGVDARGFEGDHLVQMHLAVEAALRAPANLFVRRYSVACKRDNSGGYDFSTVFVEHFWRVIDQHTADRISPSARREIERHMLVAYYPVYLWRQHLRHTGSLAAARAPFEARFGRGWLYRLWIVPILSWPRPLALAWGAMAMAVGRIAYGDLRRGLSFAWNRKRPLR